MYLVIYCIVLLICRFFVGKFLLEALAGKLHYVRKSEFITYCQID